MSSLGDSSDHSKASFMKEITSPLGGTAKLIETRSTAHLAKLYAEEINYFPDFGGLEEIALYECETSGYRFFYPFTLEGKEDLYRAIEDAEWCYEETKWEHEAVAARIPEDALVLDVGCGRGAFLAKVRSSQVTGIELNKSAASTARDRGFHVVEELIGDHSGSYDFVTAFQVLEHVADPLRFLRDCLAALRPGGTLVIAVPNNDAFIRFADLPLNQPPHHVGLWTPRSLAALTNLLPIQLQTIEEEPLRERDWYRQVIEDRYLPKSRLIRKLYYLFGANKVVHRYVEENARSISGHTVIAIYTKAEASLTS